MNQLIHLQSQKSILELRSRIIRAMREFFWSEGFLEVETPTIVKFPGQEPYLSPMMIDIHDETGKTYRGALHTSPEYTMKKMLAAGFDRIFSLGKVFRDRESFGGAHNPEFTMIEWYRTNVDFNALIDDCEKLLKYVRKQMGKGQLGNWAIGQFGSGNPITKLPNYQITKVHMRDLWKQYAKADLDDLLDEKAMRDLCQKKGYKPKRDEPYDDLFNRIFLNEIETNFPKDEVTIVHHYPAQMAALAKLSDEDPRYAERFEVYAGGLELANAFTELTDPVEQRKRFEEEQHRRKELGKEVYPIDEEFIAALAHMPPAAGIALGVDRLVMTLAGCEKIEEVIALPASLQFIANGQ